ncbi:2-keto-4-pentenoate hydratase [Limosilactobacillus mucosae]|uniref:2-keto-4-pentenoate hydratase n=1 Tax=Limosilactobacillus mucosae TaxID=97478 RepID=UPI0035200F9D
MTEQQANLTANQEKFAQALYDAYKSGNPLLESEWEGVVTDDDTAYRVQDRVMALKNQEVGGYKVSLTSEETQKMFDSDSPLYGQQVADHFLKSPAEVKLSDRMAALTEVELGFRAKEDLSPDDSLEDLMKKTTVCGTLEVPDSRFKDWFPSLSKYNVMSDCAVGGLVVYGEERDTDKVFATPEDAAKVHAELYFNGEKKDEGDSSEVLGNPLKSLQWLVAKLASQGKQFKKGQLVSSGTFVLPPKLVAGKWEAKFDHGFGTVELNVTD